MNIDCRDSDRGYNSVSKPGGDDRARILGTRSFGECPSTHAIAAANDRHLEMDGSLVQFMCSLSGMSPLIIYIHTFFIPLLDMLASNGDSTKSRRQGFEYCKPSTVSRVSPLRRLGC